MTFGPKKLQNMAGIFMIMVLGSVMIYIDDMQKPTRLELESLFETELSNCQIASLVERQYSGKGKYQLFLTDCNSKYYPILLDKESDYQDYDRFKEGLIVNKKANSVNLILTDSNTKLELKIRHPSDEDDRFESIKFAVIFFGIGLLIMVFLPNSFWERNRN
jgi:hypothetical protein